MEQQTQATDAGEQGIHDGDSMDELLTDKAGQEDVEGTGDSLSLEELNKTFGREFKSKEEALKHAENLKSFAGDQEAIKERKAQKELEEQKKKGLDALSRVETLEKEIAKKDFLIETPTAKQFMPALEAYAEKQGMSLEEAWSSEQFKPIAEASTRISKSPVTNNRITPVRSQTIEKLKEEVKTTGSDTAKVNLVKEYFKK